MLSAAHDDAESEGWLPEFSQAASAGVRRRSSRDDELLAGSDSRRLILYKVGAIKRQAERSLSAADLHQRTVVASVAGRSFAAGARGGRSDASGTMHHPAPFKPSLHGRTLTEDLLVGARRGGMLPSLSASRLAVSAQASRTLLSAPPTPGSSAASRSHSASRTLLGTLQERSGSALLPLAAARGAADTEAGADGAVTGAPDNRVVKIGVKPPGRIPSRAALLLRRRGGHSPSALSPTSSSSPLSFPTPVIGPSQGGAHSRPPPLQDSRTPSPGLRASPSTLMRRHPSGSHSAASAQAQPFSLGAAALPLVSGSAPIARYRLPSGATAASDGTDRLRHGESRALLTDSPFRSSASSQQLNPTASLSSLGAPAEAAAGVRTRRAPPVTAGDMWLQQRLHLRRIYIPDVHGDGGDLGSAAGAAGQRGAGRLSMARPRPSVVAPPHTAPAGATRRQTLLVPSAAAPGDPASVSPSRGSSAVGAARPRGLLHDTHARTASASATRLPSPPRFNDSARVDKRTAAFLLADRTRWLTESQAANLQAVTAGEAGSAVAEHRVAWTLEQVRKVPAVRDGLLQRVAEYQRERSAAKERAADILRRNASSAALLSRRPLEMQQTLEERRAADEARAQAVREAAALAEEQRVQAAVAMAERNAALAAEREVKEQQMTWLMVLVLANAAHRFVRVMAVEQAVSSKSTAAQGAAVKLQSWWRSVYYKRWYRSLQKALPGLKLFLWRWRMHLVLRRRVRAAQLLRRFAQDVVLAGDDPRLISTALYRYVRHFRRCVILTQRAIRSWLACHHAKLAGLRLIWGHQQRRVAADASHSASAALSATGPAGSSRDPKGKRSSSGGSGSGSAHRRGKSGGAPGASMSPATPGTAPRGGRRASTSSVVSAVESVAGSPEAADAPGPATAPAPHSQRRGSLLASSPVGGEVASKRPNLLDASPAVRDHVLSEYLFQLKAGWARRRRAWVLETTQRLMPKVSGKVSLEETAEMMAMVSARLAHASSRGRVTADRTRAVARADGSLEADAPHGLSAGSRARPIASGKPGIGGRVPRLSLATAEVSADAGRRESVSDAAVGLLADDSIDDVEVAAAAAASAEGAGHMRLGAAGAAAPDPSQAGFRKRNFAEVAVAAMTEASLRNQRSARRRFGMTPRGQRGGGGVGDEDESQAASGGDFGPGGKIRSAAGAVDTLLLAGAATKSSLAAQASGVTTQARELLERATVPELAAAAGVRIRSPDDVEYLMDRPAVRAAIEKLRRIGISGREQVPESKTGRRVVFAQGGATGMAALGLTARGTGGSGGPPGSHPLDTAVARVAGGGAPAQAGALRRAALQRLRGKAGVTAEDILGTAVLPHCPVPLRLFSSSTDPLPLLQRLLDVAMGWAPPPPVAVTVTGPAAAHEGGSSARHAASDAAAAAAAAGSSRPALSAGSGGEEAHGVPLVFRPSLVPREGGFLLSAAGPHTVTAHAREGTAGAGSAAGSHPDAAGSGAGAGRGPPLKRSAYSVRIAK